MVLLKYIYLSKEWIAIYILGVGTSVPSDGTKVPAPKYTRIEIIIL